jgi:hypothetical protein
VLLADPYVTSNYVYTLRSQLGISGAKTYWLFFQIATLPLFHRKACQQINEINDHLLSAGGSSVMLYTTMSPFLTRLEDDVSYPSPLQLEINLTSIGHQPGTTPPQYMCN